MAEWCKIHSFTLFIIIVFLVFILFCLFISLMEEVWITILVSAIIVFVLIFNVYAEETENYTTHLKQKQFIESLESRIDKNYKLQIEDKEIYSQKVKKEMLGKYKDVSEYYIDYEDDEKVIYIRKKP